MEKKTKQMMGGIETLIIEEKPLDINEDTIIEINPEILENMKRRLKEGKKHEKHPKK